MKRLKMSISQSTRKCTSIILSLVMVISLFSFSMITTNATSDTTTKTVNVKDATKATDVEGLVTDKTATANADGTFTLNLEAYAKGEIKTSEVTKPSDIVLTLDVSGSMYYTMGNKIKFSDLDTTKPDYYYRRGSLNDDANDNKYDNYLRYRDGKWQECGASGGNWKEVKNPSYKNYYVTRIGALKESANNFIDSVAEDCKNLDSSLENKHRIAITTFNGSGEQVQGFLDVSKPKNVNTLKEKINALTPGGSTNTGDGLANAYKYFNENSLKTENRNKVEIMFTDGVPTTSSDFSESVANNAISYAHKIKNETNIKAQVYTIGIFTGAATSGALPNYNWLSTETEAANRFMHLVSSNYPNSKDINTPGSDGATSKGYYLAAANADDLSKIFEKISESIAKPSIELDEKTILQDILSDEFVLAGESADSIKTFTMEYSGKDSGGNDTFKNKTAITNLNVAINPDKNTIQVSGFNYGENFCAIPDNGGNPTGKKLILEIKVKRNQTTYGGNGIPTNTIASAIYDGKTKDAVETFPIPTVNLDIRYDITTKNKSIYLGDTVKAEDLIIFPTNYNGKYNENLNINCKPDGKNNKYITIDYTFSNSVTGKSLSITLKPGETFNISYFDNLLNDLNKNTMYVLEINAGGIQFIEFANVYVFTPVIQATDQTIFYGDKADDLVKRLTVTSWTCKDNNAAKPDSVEPNVSYELKQVNGETIPTDLTLEDTLDVKIEKVKLNDKAVDSQYVEIKEDNSCQVKVHDKDKDFTIHVVKGQIEINKNITAQYSNESKINSYQTFVYKIERSETASGEVVETFYQTISFDATKTDKEAKAIISNLKKGYYTVTEEESWSKKYTLSTTTDNYQHLNGGEGAGTNLPIGLYNNLTGYYGLDEECYQEKGFEGKKAQVTFKNNLKSWAGWYSDAAGSKNTFNK